MWRILKRFQKHQFSKVDEEQPDTERLGTRIGLALLSCQLAERNLYKIMTKYMGEEWHKPPTFGQMVYRLKTNWPQLGDAIEALAEFRDIRNAFVHSLLNAEGADLGTAAGRAACYMQAAEAHAMAAAVMRGFGEIYEEYYTVSGFYWPERLNRK